MDLARDGRGCGAAGGGNHRETRSDAYGEGWNDVKLHALIPKVNVLDISEFDRRLPGDFDAARPDVKRYTERRRSKGNAKLDIRVEGLDGLVLRMLPVIVVEIGGCQAAILGHARVGGAGIDRVLF